jgi:GntR family transcriptional regulator
MYVSVDHKSRVPLYVQLKEQLHLAVATGVLRPGDQLPTVRDLAVRLRVNPNTVARVYRELQAEGLFVSRQGSGTFVADDARAVGQAEGRAILRQRLAEAASLAHSLDLSAAELRRLTDDAWQAAKAGREEVTPDEHD